MYVEKKKNISNALKKISMYQIFFWGKKIRLTKVCGCYSTYSPNTVVILIHVKNKKACNFHSCKKKKQACNSLSVHLCQDQFNDLLFYFVLFFETQMNWNFIAKRKSMIHYLCSKLWQGSNSLASSKSRSLEQISS